MRKNLLLLKIQTKIGSERMVRKKQISSFNNIRAWTGLRPTREVIQTTSDAELTPKSSGGKEEDQ